MNDYFVRIYDDKFNIFNYYTIKDLLNENANAHDDILDEYIQTFTGVCDKTNKQIFIGDIILIDILDSLNTNLIDNEYREVYYKKCLFIVIFEHGSYGYIPMYPILQHEDDKGFTPFLNNGDNWGNYCLVVSNTLQHKKRNK